MAKKKYSQDPTSIMDKIFDKYIVLIEDDTTNDDFEKIEKSLDLLSLNNLGMKITGFSSNYYGNPTSYDIMSKFMIKYNKDLKKKRRKIKRGEYGYPDNISVKDPKELVELKSFGLDIGRHYARLDKDNFAILEVKMDPEEDFDFRASLYLIGKKYDKYYNEYSKIFEEYEKVANNANVDKIVRHTSSEDKTVSDTNFKSIDKIVFSDKEKVIHYIDNWYNNIPRYYKDYGITPKLSIMIYGPPGTGKSTFATAIAKYFKISIIDSFDPLYFNQASQAARSGSPGRRRVRSSAGICLLDDIDCICKSREDDDSASNMAILATLLSFLDNPQVINIKAKDNIYYPCSIVIATTNYYDKLDAAIKRHGRFDLTFEMNEFNRDEAIEYCNFYQLNLDDVVPDAKKKGFTIVPAELQMICLSNLDASMKNV